MLVYPQDRILVVFGLLLKVGYFLLLLELKQKAKDDFLACVISERNLLFTKVTDCVKNSREVKIKDGFGLNGLVWFKKVTELRDIRFLKQNRFVFHATLKVFKTPPDFIVSVKRVKSVFSYGCTEIIGQVVRKIHYV